MKNTITVRRDLTPTLTKLILALLFLLGVALVFMGWRCQVKSAASGYTSDGAYQAIYKLTCDVNAAWSERVRPELDRLSEADRDAVDGVILDLAADAVGGAEGIPEAVSDYHYKLVYAAYLVSGPKVTGALKKGIAKLSDADAADFRASVLQCLLDDSLPVPAQAEKLVGDAEGTARRAGLTQAFFVSLGSIEGDVTEHVNTFKKSVRGKAQQATAFMAIASGSANWLWTFFVSHSRTAVLIGVALMLDMALLALLMASDKRWAFDFKWIMILLIVDFLLLFQMLPMVFMLIRAVFPQGQFSLNTLRRLFTYPMNLEALKNTMLAATATMVLGTLIAFPLAWLVGRTNLYGRKFFRALFVMTYMVPPYVGAMAWLRLTNPNVGTINQWLRVLFHLPNTPGPLNVYTLPGMVWVLTTFYYPYAFITISRAMEKMDP